LKTFNQLEPKPFPIEKMLLTDLPRKTIKWNNLISLRYFKLDNISKL
jgi:hypothetical protein